MVYLHGGGWMLGSIDSFDTLVRALANASGAIVVSVGYRLAPEAPFPAGLEDCLCAVRWLAANAAELGARPRAARDRRRQRGRQPGGRRRAPPARGGRPADAGADLPGHRRGLQHASYGDFGEGHGLTAASMQRFWHLYLDGADGLDPDASPLRADDLAGSPPAFVLTAGFDPLRDEGEAYCEALRDAGVEAEVSRYDGAIHGFWRWLAAAKLSRHAVDEVAGALRARLA